MNKKRICIYTVLFILLFVIIFINPTKIYAASNKSVKKLTCLNELRKGKIVLDEGSSLKLKIKTIFRNNKSTKSLKRLQFRSSNVKVVKVSKSGKITALSCGSATITVMDKSKKKCRIKVEVTKKPIATPEPKPTSTPKPTVEPSVKPNYNIDIPETTCFEQDGVKIVLSSIEIQEDNSFVNFVIKNDNPYNKKVSVAFEYFNINGVSTPLLRKQTGYVCSGEQSQFSWRIDENIVKKYYQVMKELDVDQNEVDIEKISFNIVVCIGEKEPAITVNNYELHTSAYKGTDFTQYFGVYQNSYNIISDLNYRFDNKSVNLDIPSDIYLKKCKDGIAVTAVAKDIVQEEGCYAYVSQSLVVNPKHPFVSNLTENERRSYGPNFDCGGRLNSLGAMVTKYKNIFIKNIRQEYEIPNDEKIVFELALYCARGNDQDLDSQYHFVTVEEDFFP